MQLNTKKKKTLKRNNLWESEKIGEKSGEGIEAEVKQRDILYISWPKLLEFDVI